MSEFGSPPNDQNPPQNFAQQPQGPNVPDYLVQSILMTVAGAICCVLPLPAGIVALVCTLRANSKKGQGDFNGALNDARTAKKALWIGVALLIAAVVIGIILVAVVGIFGETDTSGDFSTDY